MTETELLFSEILNCDRLSLYLNRRQTLGRDKSFLISSVLKRRIEGEPIQYILGKTEFMDLEFKINNNVFIPRPETEILVETTVNTIKLLNCHTIKLLDTGTGSGCIAISLAKFLPDVKIIAVDISGEAIELAKYNAILNNLNKRIRFIQSDLFTDYRLPLPVRQAGITDYDVIVSNPPYIPAAEIDKLEPEIRHEPRIALDGGEDGLDFYRRLIYESPYYLKRGGLLIMEMGFNQIDAIRNIFQKSGNFEIIEVVKDYNNIDRVIVAQKQNG